MKFYFYTAILAINCSPTAAYKFEDLKACIAMGSKIGS